MEHYSQCLEEIRPILSKDSSRLKDEQKELLTLWKDKLGCFPPDKYRDALLNLIHDRETVKYWPVRKSLEWEPLKVGNQLWYPVTEFGEISTFDIAPPTRETEISEQLEKLQLNMGSEDQEAELGAKDESFNFLNISANSDRIKTTHSFVLALILVAEMGNSYLQSLVKLFPNDMVKVKLRCLGKWREFELSQKPPTNFHSENDNSLPGLAGYLEEAYYILQDVGPRFSGGNMAIEIFILTGWIPETKKIDSLSLADVADLIRLKKLGRNTLGLGTSEMSKQNANKIGVVKGYQYVVSDFDEESKMVTITVPWVKPGIKGRLLKFHISCIRDFTCIYINWIHTQDHVEMDILDWFFTSKIELKYIGDSTQYILTNTTDQIQNVRFLIRQRIQLVLFPRAER